MCRVEKPFASINKVFFCELELNVHIQAANDSPQLPRAISIQAEGKRLLEKHAIAPPAARLCWGDSDKRPQAQLRGLLLGFKNNSTTHSQFLILVITTRRPTSELTGRGDYIQHFESIRQVVKRAARAPVQRVVPCTCDHSSVLGRMRRASVVMIKRLNETWGRSTTTPEGCPSQSKPQHALPAFSKHRH